MGGIEYDFSIPSHVELPTIVGLQLLDLSEVSVDVILIINITRIPLDRQWHTGISRSCSS